MGPAADTSSSQGGHSQCSPVTTPFASNILIRDAAFDSRPRGARELRERIREYEDRVRRTIAEADAEQVGETPNDLRPRMLAEAVCGCFEAARTSGWPAHATSRCTSRRRDQVRRAGPRPDRRRIAPHLLNMAPVQSRY
jgi:hypothetical protein